MRITSGSMARKIGFESLQGVWSASPSPLTERLEIDPVAVKRMVDHHLRLGITTIFLAGTCGEGPWMPDRERRSLVRTVAKHSKGKVLIAVQVTDNSAARILDNIHTAKSDGAHIAIIAPPLFLLNAKPKAIHQLYLQAIRESPLPVGIYDRGNFGPVVVPKAVLSSIYNETNVIVVKDSSADPEHLSIALKARKKRPELTLLCGDEFNCLTYLKGGYNGLLLGGGIFNGYIARKIVEAMTEGDLRRATLLQRRMNNLMYAVYGGKKYGCWLSGLKRLLVEMGIFRTWHSYLDYPLTDACIRNIKRVVKQNASILFP
jgi:dihydrodipicolinate synthase/N-acetylneuraminate lyase